MGESTGEESSGAESNPPAHPVFLSYASTDAATAQGICEFLESHGVSCWMAPRDVRPGTEYADAIVAAINEAKSVVLVLSGSAVASSHVGREVERAASKRKQLVAFRIDPAPLSRSFEYFLSNSQWIDVPALGMPAALDKLAEAVGQGAVQAGASDADFPGRRKRRRLAVAVAVGLAVVVVIVLGVYCWTSKRSSHTTAAAIGDKSIAVLPFVDMSEKKDQEYFGDGMAEEILDLLAKIPGLTVIGRTSSFQFKGQNEDLRSIGKTLNAAYVLEGSVRRSPDQIRITAQLINTKTGTHEWSETYDRPIGDVLKLQNAIAAAVVREMQLTVSPDNVYRQTSVKNPEAYDVYLRGRHAFDRHDAEGLAEAVSMFQRALDNDPNFADAAVSLAWAKASQAQFDFEPPAAAFEQSRAAAMTALKLDPNNAGAHAALGQIYLVYDWDWEAAEREFQQVTRLAPGSVDAHYSNTLLSLTLGHWDDALKELKGGISQDPLDPDSFQILGQLQATRGHLAEAEAALRRLIEIHPTYAYAHYYLGLVLLLRGNPENALREMQAETTEDGKQQGVTIVLYALGKRTDSDSALAAMIKDQANRNAVGIADVYALRGRPDEAVQWLDRAYVQKDPELYVVKSETELQGLNSDPGFKAFLKKMNLPE
jgi:adenylate cyclase